MGLTGLAQIFGGYGYGIGYTSISGFVMIGSIYSNRKLLKNASLGYDASAVE